MDSFKGTFDELKTIIDSKGLVGTWGSTGSCHQFRHGDGCIINWFSTTGKLQYQGPADARNGLFEVMSGQIKLDPIKGDSRQNKKIFIVHGHDSTSREQLELIIHKLGLDPFVLVNNGGEGLTIIEALEKYINPNKDGCSFGIVLLTPDDMGYAKNDGTDKEQPRARQNVVLEMGMLISALGRGNVAILKKGYIETPSDAQGIIYIPYNDHVKETVPKLVSRLDSAGFTLTPEQISSASS